MLGSSDVLSMLMRRKPAYLLAQGFHVGPDIFQVDLLHVGRRERGAIPSCEVPRSGDHDAFERGVCSVVILRSADGQIGASRNTRQDRRAVRCKTDIVSWFPMTAPARSSRLRARSQRARSTSSTAEA